MNLPFLDLLTAFGQSLLFAFIGVLPILNPLATAPLFVDQARGLSDQGPSRPPPTMPHKWPRP